MIGPLGLGAVAVSRPLFEGIGPLGRVIFYSLAGLSTAVFGWGIWCKVRKYRMGRPAGRWLMIRAALGSRLRSIGKGTSVARANRASGAAHFFIFWSFVAALMATVILTVDTDVVRNVSGLIAGHQDSFFHGTFFIVYTFVVDTMGFAFLVSVAYMAVRRGILRPHQLDYSRAGTPVGSYSRKPMVEGDWLFLGLLASILITAYLLTGLRILGQRMPWFTAFSPFGRGVAEIFSGLGMTPAEAVSAHGVIWWVHAALALGFVAYIPYSKAMHMLIDIVNLVATDRSATLTLPPPATDHAGYQKLSDFTWKELLDFDACTKCGRCHAVCPARTCGMPLSPRELILDLRQWANASVGGIALLDQERRIEPTGPLAKGNARLAGDVIAADALWSCTTCMHCVEICPVGIEHVPTIVQLRRSLVDEGTMDFALQKVLQNLATQGNSFGKSARMRARWTRELGFEIPDARKQAVKYLWFVGDFASYDERLVDISRALATILHNAGVDFGLLYDSEHNAGNDVRRVGEEGLFEMLALHNIEALSEAHFDEIFTTDPHTLNALRNEYRGLGASYAVRHYTELLAQLLESGRDRRQAARLPRDLSRPVLPGSVQRRAGCSPSHSSGARMRACRDASQQIGHILLWRGWRPHLDGRQRSW